VDVFPDQQNRSSLKLPANSANGKQQMEARILITDDTIFTRTVLKSILSANGFKNFVEAGNGEEAVKLYKSHQPDVVLMDITMPIMDGLTALKEIRAIDPQAKVIMCTALGQKNMVVEAIQSGARDFIVKPFQSNRVLESVNRILEVEAA
jgi:two-component system chemotaxis response regulator CheY